MGRAWALSHTHAPAPSLHSYHVATSTVPEGPFTVVVANASTDNSNADDFDLFVEGGNGYIVYDQNLASLRVAKLTPDFLAFDTSVPPSVLVDGNYEAPSVFKRGDTYYFLYGWITCFGKRGAGVSVKTAKSMLGPYSSPAYDVGCRGDTYDPNGPCYATLLAQQAWVTKITCAKTGEEQFLWVGDQWLSDPAKRFGGSRQAWVPLSFDDSVSPPVIRKQVAAVDPARGIAADILVKDGCLVTACGDDPSPVPCVKNAVKEILRPGGDAEAGAECLLKFCSLDAKAAGRVKDCVAAKELKPKDLAACVVGAQ